MVVRLTREERQRIAAKLRNVEIENLGAYEYSAHLGEAIGECVRLVSGHEILVKRGLNRLADLIEPEERMCQQVLTECNDELQLIVANAALNGDIRQTIVRIAE